MWVYRRAPQESPSWLENFRARLNWPQRMWSLKQSQRLGKAGAWRKISTQREPWSFYWILMGTMVILYDFIWRDKIVASRFLMVTSWWFSGVTNYFIEIQWAPYWIQVRIVRECLILSSRPQLNWLWTKDLNPEFGASTCTQIYQWKTVVFVRKSSIDGGLSRSIYVFQ